MNSQPPTTLIIGASSSFGEAIARRLAVEGHQLVLAHSGRKIYQAPAGCGGKIIKCDVTDVQEIDHAIAECRTVINNIIYSVSPPVSFKKFKDEEWIDYEEHWQTQVKGLWHILQALFKYNNPFKSVIVIGSAVTFGKPMPRLGAYITAKYALLGLIKFLSVELAPMGVRANMISPPATGVGLSENWPKVFLRAAPTTNPDKVAEAVVSLLNPDDKRTGENIAVDSLQNF